MANQIYVATYVTESGDRGVVGYWTKEPSETKLREYFKKLMPDEFLEDDDGSGPGYDCLVYWEVECLNLL